MPYNPIVLVLAANGSAPFGPIGLEQQARFFGLGLLVSMLLIAVAIRRIRAVVVRQAGGPEKNRWEIQWSGGGRGPFERLSRHLPSPSLDFNPVLWREWHRRRPSGWSITIWSGFALISGVASLYAITHALKGSPLSLELASFINGAQVSAGLLLLSISASTSLAEERQRGSLDVLLASPLSTRSIVVAKWWGAFRGILPLTILPVLVTASLTMHTRFGLGSLLIGGLIVAYGAAITSLGLALATWVSGLGRVVGLSAGLYIAVLFGAIAVGGMFFENTETGPGLATASPFMGMYYSSAIFGGISIGFKAESQAGWMVFWIVAYGLISLGLLVATLRTFNRCLGRIDDPSQDRQLPPRGREPK